MYFRLSDIIINLGGDFRIKRTRLLEGNFENSPEEVPRSCLWARRDLKCYFSLLRGTRSKTAYYLLNQFNINVAHKPAMTVGSFLKKAIDKLSKDLSTGWIYKINIQDYDKVYIGQTSRDLRSRTGENKRAIFKGVKNSLLAQHCIQNNHEFDLDDLKIIDLCSQWSKTLVLEAWHSICGPNAINEQICFPDIYKTLGNPK